MPLNPTTFVTLTRDVHTDQDGFTEGKGQTVVKSGFYEDVATGERQLIEQLRITKNQLGTIIRKDFLEVTIEMPGAAPTETLLTSWSNVWLPGINQQRRLLKTQEERTLYWPYTALTSKDTMGCTRILDAYVVYTETHSTAALSSDETDHATEQGRDATGTPGVVIDSGKLWSDAVRNGSIIDTNSSNQITRWVTGVVYQEDIVEEEAGGWWVWTETKNSLNPGDVQYTEPRWVRKPGFRWRLPVAITPPELTATATANGIAVRVEGGGATLTHSGIEASSTIPVESYRIERLVESEGARSSSSNIYDWWSSPPVAPEATDLLTDASVTDLTGTPTTLLPAQTSYSEPDDTSEPDEPVWEQIAEVDNIYATSTSETGACDYLDADVISGGQYSYRAVAVISRDASEYSNTDTATATASPDRSYRIGVTKTDPDGQHGGPFWEYDASAPDDPLFPDTAFGEVAIFEVPAMVAPGEFAVGSGGGAGGLYGSDSTYDNLADDYVEASAPGDGTETGHIDPDTGEIEMDDGTGGGGSGNKIEPAETVYTDLMTIEELGNAVAARVFAADRQELLTSTLEIEAPVLGLRRWQNILTPEIEWSTMGNSRQWETTANDITWKLAGHKLTMRYGEVTTTLKLVER